MKSQSHTNRRRRGFTLPEILIASSIMILLSTGVITFYVMLKKSWLKTTVAMTASLKATSAIEWMVHGKNPVMGLREAIGDTASVTNSASGWTLYFNTNRWVRYSNVSQTLTESAGSTLCGNVINSSCTVSYAGTAISFDVAEGYGPYRVTNRFMTYVNFRN